MQLQLPGLQQHKAIVELAHSRQSVQPEVHQIGQLAAEVIKLRQEAEAARLEALALDKELEISRLLGKLELEPSLESGLPQLVETLPEGSQHHGDHSHQRKQQQQHPNKPKQWQQRPSNPKQWQQRPRRPQRQQHPNRERQEDHQEANCRRGPQGGNHPQGRRQGPQEDRQEGHQVASHWQQRRNKQRKCPMRPMGQ